jgi:CRP-like cAMP-binding protein
LDVFQEAEMLRKVPMFGGFSAAELKLLAFTSRLLKFAPGDVLMQRGDPADCAYVILEGEAEVIGKTSAGEFVVAVTGVNACVGEMGVLTDPAVGHRSRARSGHGAAHHRRGVPASRQRESGRRPARDAPAELAARQRNAGQRNPAGAAARRRGARGPPRHLTLAAPLSRSTRRSAAAEATRGHRDREDASGGGSYAAPATR